MYKVAAVKLQIGVDHLSGIAKEANDALGVEGAKVVADMDYYNDEESNGGEKKGIKWSHH